MLSLLLDKGLDLLWGAAKSLTDTGVKALTDKVEDVTGIDLNSADDLTPEQTLALKQFEQDHQQFMAQLRLDYAKLEMEDRKDARGMQEKALAQDDKVAKQFVYWLATFCILSTILYFFCVTFIPIPTSASQYVQFIIGYLSGTLTSPIMNFFFGSSTGSKEKDKQLGDKVWTTIKK